MLSDPFNPIGSEQRTVRSAHLAYLCLSILKWQRWLPRYHSSGVTDHTLRVREIRPLPGGKDAPPLGSRTSTVLIAMSPTAPTASGAAEVDTHAQLTPISRTAARALAVPSSCGEHGRKFDDVAHVPTGVPVEGVWLFNTGAVHGFHLQDILTRATGHEQCALAAEIVFPKAFFKACRHPRSTSIGGK